MSQRTVRHRQRRWVGLLISAAIGSLLLSIGSTGTPARAASQEPQRHLTARQLQQLIGDHGQYELDDAVVTGDVTLSVLELITSHVTFEGNVTLSPPLSGPSRTPDARYVFLHTEFKGQVHLANNVQVLRAESCRFDSDLSLAGGDIQSLALLNSSFEAHTFVQRARVGLLDVEGSHFGGTAYFTATVFDSVRFDDVTADAPMELSLSQLGPNWLGEQVSDAHRPAAKVSETLGTLAFLERNLRSIDRVADATQVHFARVRVQRSQWTPLSPKWTLSYLPQMYNGYGTRPWQPVLIGLFVILAFGIVFHIGSAFVPDAEAKVVVPREPTWLHSLMFSADTFVPVVTISGVRDWGWRIDPGWRWVEVSERVAGAALTALATVSLLTYL